jgi:hypothetical protein
VPSTAVELVSEAGRVASRGVAGLDQIALTLISVSQGLRGLVWQYCSFGMLGTQFAHV